MKAPLRTVVILGVLALAGLTALGFLAQRYRRMVPDAPAEAPAAVPVEAPAEAPSETPSEPPPVAAPPAGPTPETLALVDRFVEVRRAVRAKLDQYPYQKQVLEEELENEETRFKKVPMSLETLAGIRIARGGALVQAGLSAEDYERIRRAWTALRDGTESVDPALAAALEARRGALDEVDLGGLEALDYELAL